MSLDMQPLKEKHISLGIISKRKLHKVPRSGNLLKIFCSGQPKGTFISVLYSLAFNFNYL